MKIKVAIIGAGATGMGVASKLLRSAKNNNKSFEIHVYQEKNYISLATCGIPYFLANDFKNAKLLTERTKKDYSKKNLKDDKNHHKIKIHLNHHVSKIDPVKQEIHVQKIKDTTSKKNKPQIVNYHMLVIASGANAKVPPPFDNGMLPTNVYNVFNREDALNLKKALKTAQKIAIVGGGFIGMEMAETCLKQKKDVTIIEMKDRLMADVVDHEFSSLIYKELTENKKTANAKKEKKYAKILLNHKIEELMLTGTNTVSHLRVKNIADNKSGSTLTCDLIILAVGFAPNTNFLKGTSIELSKSDAIIINEFCQVKASNATKKFSNIYAGGDCTQIYSQIDKSPQYLALATNANKVARIIAQNIENPVNKFQGSLGSSIVRVGKLEIARTGSYQNISKEEVKSIYIHDFDLPRYLSQSKPLYLKLFYHKTTFQLLAAQIAGYNHATLRINALATAIWNKMDVRQLQYLDFAYAPPFSRVSDIIHIASRKVSS